MENQGSTVPETNSAKPAQSSVKSPATLPEKSPVIRSIERVTIWIMVLSTIALALISILAIWGLFNNTGDVVGRSMGTIAVIAFAALVVNVGANTLDHSKKK